MNGLIAVVVLVLLWRGWVLREQRQRIALLGQHLAHFQIEQLTQQLVQGWMRALAEADTQRQASIWSMLAGAETQLCDQVSALALDFSKVPEPQARLSRLPLALPAVTRWWPAVCIDVRKLLSLHAHALLQAAQGAPDLPPKRKAFIFMAEVFLFQHSCHWFCRSKWVASMRLLARHQTSYAQVLASVAPSTRQAYQNLTGVTAGVA